MEPTDENIRAFEDAHKARPEPAELPPVVQRTLGDLNRERGVSMLIVEQNANLALGIATRGYVLETGTIVTSGSADELAGNDEVRRAYLGI